MQKELSFKVLEINECKGEGKATWTRRGVFKDGRIVDVSNKGMLALYTNVNGRKTFVSKDKGEFLAKDVREFMRHGDVSPFLVSAQERQLTEDVEILNDIVAGLKVQIPDLDQDELQVLAFKRFQKATEGRKPSTQLQARIFPRV